MESDQLKFLIFIWVKSALRTCKRYNGGRSLGRGGVSEGPVCSGIQLPFTGEPSTAGAGGFKPSLFTSI